MAHREDLLSVRLHTLNQDRLDNKCRIRMRVEVLKVCCRNVCPSLPVAQHTLVQSGCVGFQRFGSERLQLTSFCLSTSSDLCSQSSFANHVSTTGTNVLSVVFLDLRIPLGLLKGVVHLQVKGGPVRVPGRSSWAFG